MMSSSFNASGGRAFSRRSFVAGLAVASSAGALALAGCSAQEEKPQPAAEQPAAPEQGNAQLQPSEPDLSSAATPLQLASGCVVVTEYAGNSLAVVDPQNPGVLQRISCGSNPARLALGEGFLFVSESGSGTVRFVPLDSPSDAVTVAVGNQPFGLCFDQDRNLLYATDYHRGTIVAIDPSLQSVIDSVGLGKVGYLKRTDPPPCCRVVGGEGRRPVALGHLPGTDMLYCLNYGTYDCAYVSLDPLQLAADYDGVVGPRSIAFTADGGHMLFAGVGGEAEQRNALLEVVDRQTGRRVTEVPIGGGVSSVAAAPDGSYYAATSYDEGVLVVLDGDFQETGRVELALGVDSLALSPDGSRAYAASSLNGTLFEVDMAALTSSVIAQDLINPKDIVVIP